MFEISLAVVIDRRPRSEQRCLPQRVGDHGRNDDHVRGDADRDLSVHARNPAPVHGGSAECAGAPALRQVGFLLFDRLFFRDELRPALFRQADHAGGARRLRDRPQSRRCGQPVRHAGERVRALSDGRGLRASVPRSFDRSCFVAGAPCSLARRWAWVRSWRSPASSSGCSTIRATARPA